MSEENGPIESDPLSSSESNQESASQGGTGENSAQVSGSRAAAQFVIFPLAIVVVGVAIYLFLGLLTVEDRSAKDYLDDIRTGGINSRWQAAFELVKVLAEANRNGEISPGFVDELIRVYKSSHHDDPRIMRYLVRAMQMVKDPAIVSVLIEALDNPDEETRFYAIVSLGAQEDTSAVMPLINKVSSDDPGVRTVSVYSLGQLDDPRAWPVLVRVLQDSSPEVRFNSALQLAQAGNDAGLDVLDQMLNRKYLESMGHWNEESRSNAMVQAIQAVGLLKSPRMKKTLQDLRESDPSMGVRQAAIQILESWEG